MAYCAHDWVIGWLRCPSCGYEWNALVDTEDMPRAGPYLVSITTGPGKFQALCPTCGKMGQLQEIAGE